MSGDINVGKYFNKPGNPGDRRKAVEQKCNKSYKLTCATDMCFRILLIIFYLIFGST